jgi:hypothetical protein
MRSTPCALERPPSSALRRALPLESGRACRDWAAACAARPAACHATRGWYRVKGGSCRAKASTKNMPTRRRNVTGFKRFETARFADAPTFKSYLTTRPSSVPTFMSDVTMRSSHVTAFTSDATMRSSLVTVFTSFIRTRSSNVTRSMSLVTTRSSLVTAFTSCVTTRSWQATAFTLNDRVRSNDDPGGSKNHPRGSSHDVAFGRLEGRAPRFLSVVTRHTTTGTCAEIAPSQEKKRNPRHQSPDPSLPGERRPHALGGRFALAIAPLLLIRRTRGPPDSLCSPGASGRALRGISLGPLPRPRYAAMVFLPRAR